MVQLHRELEVCEARIVCGTDSLHLHPILSRKARDESRGIVLTEHELGRTRRYDVTVVPSRSHGFWPARVWDCAASRMSDEETRALASRLEVETKAGLSSTPPMRRSLTIGPRRMKQRRASTVTLDAYDYATDDDGTDLEDP